MNDRFDYDAITALLVKAGELFSDEKKKEEILVKGKADFATQVDFAVQDFLYRELGNMYPEVQFLGEEGEKEQWDRTKPAWILDPVDGTTNLIHDMKMSVISLALWDGKDLAFGCIYNPYQKEICTAVRGQGARLNGKKVSVSKASKLEDCLLAIGTTPYDKELYGDRIFERMKRMYLSCRDIRRTGSAALDLFCIAAGKTGGYFEYYLKPWDFAAGMLLVEEAGGKVTDPDGNRPFPGEPADIVATNGRVHDELLELLK